MNVIIDHYPAREFCFFSNVRSSTFSIDINESIKSKLKPEELLTNKLALKILRQIRLKSNFLAFITKPAVLIPFTVVCSIGLGVACAAVPVVGPLAATVALIGVKIILFVADCAAYFFMGWTIRSAIIGNLSDLSKAYSQQAERANEYIRMLKGHGDVNLIL